MEYYALAVKGYRELEGVDLHRLDPKNKNISVKASSREILVLLLFASRNRRADQSVSAQLTCT